MSLATGTKFGPYEIVAALGAGGMGEVYRARDTRLDRDVAIKVLPPQLAADPQLRERFDREAHAIAALNHPHICALHDVGEQDGTAFLVMEHVEGETLAARLAKGALPIEQVLRCAIEIADALDKAHRAGIVHRDLKPGNIMLTKSGVKLLDFGLAKTTAAAIAGSGGSMLPTTPPHLTAQGMILGTLQYMAPEQLEGREADARTDLFAFGAVVYEMATGQKAFEGKSQASLIAAILEHEPPPIVTIQPLTPVALDRVVRGCLAKDPDDRWQSARDVGKQLRGVTDDVSPTRSPNTAGRREWAAWLAAAAAVAVVVLSLPVLIGHWRERSVSPSAVRASFTFPADVHLPGVSPLITLSPDGKYLALTGVDSAGSRIWMRPLDSAAASPLPGTEGAASRAFWAPDSQHLAFVVAGQLKRVSVRGGGTQTICNLPRTTSNNVLGAWGSSDVIVFAQPPSVLFRVPATGGQPVPITELQPGEATHTRPDFLPDGRHFTYSAPAAIAAGGFDGSVYVASIDASDRKLLLRSRAGTQFVAPDRILFVNGSTILTQRLDLSRFAVEGEPAVLADDLSGIGSFSSSQTGGLVYTSGTMTQLTLLRRDGKPLATVADPGMFQTMSIAPDERRIAYGRIDPGGVSNLWITDLERNTSSRLTFADEGASDAAWSPDGKEIIFNRFQGGRRNLYRIPASGGAERLVLASPDGKVLSVDDWSRDGQFLLYKTDMANELMAMPLAGGAKPFTVFRPTTGSVDESTFSRDGHWIAYNSNESGRPEIYVRRFPPSDDKWLISVGGGVQPRWRADGRELFYLAPDGSMMAVDVRVGAGVEPGTPHKLFDTHMLPSFSVDQYGVNGAGDRFVIMQPVSTLNSVTVKAVINWFSLLPK